MALIIDGNVSVPAERQQVWESLFDAPTLQRVLNRVPGVNVERFERMSPTEYEGQASVSVAMVKGRYDFKVAVVDQRPCEWIKLDARGVGGGNKAQGEVNLTLHPDGEATRLEYSAAGNLTGPLANFGQRLVDSIGKQFIAAGAQAMAEELASKPRPAPAIAEARRQASIPVWVYALGAAALLALSIAVWIILRSF